MNFQRPPTLDPIAVSRWQRTAPLASPWLHEEVAARMQDRLQWIKLPPQALLAGWHQALKVGGFLMFSCLGPDTARELREVYAQLGWPPAGHELTDMHDWGDMLVQTGFAEPVMDMERITLTYETPARLL